MQIFIAKKVWKTKASFSANFTNYKLFLEHIDALNEDLAYNGSETGLLIMFKFIYYFYKYNGRDL